MVIHYYVSFDADALKYGPFATYESAQLYGETYIDAFSYFQIEKRFVKVPTETIPYS